MDETIIRNYMDAFERQVRKKAREKPLRNEREIIDAIISGRKLILTAKSGVFSTFLFIGIVLWAISVFLFVYLSGEYGNRPDFWLLMGSLLLMFGIIGAAFIVPSLIFTRKNINHFFILGREGMVFRYKYKKIRFFPWNELDLDVFTPRETVSALGMKLVDYVGLELHIVLPSHEVIAIVPGLYDWKDLPSWKEIGEDQLRRLHYTAFSICLCMGKGGAPPSRAVEQKYPTPETVEHLRLVYKDFKNGKYTRGMYSSTAHIKKALDEGKTFILPGGMNGLDWCVFLAFIGVGSVPLVASILIPANIWWLAILCFAFGALILLKYSNFLIISPGGVYYKTTTGKRFFTWNEIVEIGAKREDFQSFLLIMRIEAITSSGKKHALASHLYVNKEFPKNVYRKMFYSLITIYSRLGHRGADFESPSDVSVSLPEFKK